MIARGQHVTLSGINSCHEFRTRTFFSLPFPPSSLNSSLRSTTTNNNDNPRLGLSIEEGRRLASFSFMLSPFCSFCILYCGFYCRYPPSDPCRPSPGELTAYHFVTKWGGGHGLELRLPRRWGASCASFYRGAWSTPHCRRCAYRGAWSSSPAGCWAKLLCNTTSKLRFPTGWALCDFGLSGRRR